MHCAGIVENACRSHCTRSRFLPMVVSVSEVPAEPTLPFIGPVGLIRCTWCKSAIPESSATSSRSWRGSSGSLFPDQLRQLPDLLMVFMGSTFHFEVWLLELVLLLVILKTMSLVAHGRRPCCVRVVQELLCSSLPLLPIR